MDAPSLGSNVHSRRRVFDLVLLPNYFGVLGFKIQGLSF